jgi:hypothetical protein
MRSPPAWTCYRRRFSVGNRRRSPVEACGGDGVESTGVHRDPASGAAVVKQNDKQNDAALLTVSNGILEGNRHLPFEAIHKRAGPCRAVRGHLGDTVQPRLSAALTFRWSRKKYDCRDPHADERPYEWLTFSEHSKDFENDWLHDIVSRCLGT